MKNLHDKLASRGVAALDDKELLALLVESTSDSSDAMQMAERIIGQYGSLAALLRQPLSRLRMVEGMGLRRAERLQRQLLRDGHGGRPALFQKNKVSKFQSFRGKIQEIALMRRFQIGRAHV